MIDGTVCRYVYQNAPVPCARDMPTVGANSLCGAVFVPTVARSSAESSVPDGVVCGGPGVESSVFFAIPVFAFGKGNACTPVVLLDDIRSPNFIFDGVVQVLRHPSLCADGDSLVDLAVAGVGHESVADILGIDALVGDWCSL